MDEFISKAEGFISQHQMLQTGDTVIVALSGGADSMALLHFLFLRKEALGIHLRAAHVDHAIRGAASTSDAAFVRAQCALRGVPLDETRLSPPPRASEGWAREQRYAFFEELARRHAAKVATAHTGSDNAETVLFHLARGSSVRGAAGIPPVRGFFVRPLLWAARTDVLRFLTHRGVPYVIDETNNTDAYARNRIRHNVLPLLESVHPGAAQNLMRFAADMAQTAEYLSVQADALLQGARRPAHMDVRGIPRTYSIASLAAGAPPVRCAALARLIAETGVPQQKTSLVHHAEALLLEGHGVLQLGEGFYLRFSQGLITIETSVSSDSRRLEGWSQRFSQGEHLMPSGSILSVRFGNYEEMINSAKDAQKLLKFLADYDKIQNNAFFRTRRPGDHFRPVGRGVTKPLKKWYSEQKLPFSVRETLPVLAAGSTILWAAGFGFAEGLAPTETTETTVSIRIRQMEEKA